MMLSQFSLAENRQKVIRLFVLFFAVFGVVFALTLFLMPKELSPQEKEDFPYETMSVAQMASGLVLEKPGTIKSAQNITVTAQSNGRVSRIAFKEWDEVKGGAPVVFLEDTVADYALQVQRAKNTLDRALLAKEQTKNTLDQQLQQTEAAYELATKSFELIQSGAQNTLRQADLGLLTADSQIKTLKNQFESQRIVVLNMLNSVIEPADSLLGVTEYYENRQIGESLYIGARDESLKRETQKKLRELYEIKKQIWALPAVPSSDQDLKDATQQLGVAYQQIELFAGMMIDTLKNSRLSEAVMPQSKIDQNVQLFQSFQEGQALLNAKSSFIAYSSNVNAQLLGTGTLAQDNAQLAYDNALVSTKNQILNSEIALKNARVNYDTLRQNYEVQLALQDAAITEAKIAYESALTQYAKLTIRSAISGIIGELLVAEGQEVGVGTKIFTISGKKNHQIEVFVTANEYQYLQEKVPVQVEYLGQSLTGNIESISSVADKTNLFKVIVQIDTDVELLGDVAKVVFPIAVPENKLLPLQQVNVVSEDQGLVPVFSGGQLEYIPVEIHAIWGQYVELRTPFSEDMQIIISDLSAFDENKYQLK